jgi:hypothetical protein
MQHRGVRSRRILNFYRESRAALRDFRAHSRLRRLD